MARNVIELRQPFVVQYVQREITDTAFVLAPDFRMPYTTGMPYGLTPRGAIWIPPGHRGLSIRGCSILGWSDRWLPEWSTDHPNWIGRDGSSRPLQELAGVHADYVDDLTIEGLRVEKMPGPAVYLAAALRTRVSRLLARRCFTAVYLEYFSPVASNSNFVVQAHFPKRLSADVTIEDSIARDNWGVGYPPRTDPYRDIYEPSECIGSDGFYLYSCDRLRVLRCLSVGSNKGGMKLGHCRDALVEDFYGRSILVMGCLYWSQQKGPWQLPTVAVGTLEDPLLSQDVVIRNPTLFWGTSLTPPTHIGAPLSFSWPNRTPLKVEGGHVWRPPSPVYGYLHAWEGVDADVRGVTFHGPRPAALPTYGATSGVPFAIGDYGSAVSRPSSINADLLEANEWREAD